MAEPVRIVFLGGLGEIGRNCACIEVNDRILIVDFGLMFPDLTMPGVDLVLPDFTYLRENSDRIEAAVITHGHEDHAGGLSFLLREIEFPIYGSKMTLELARNRIEEAGVMANTDLRVLADGETANIGPFVVETIPVTHSVPHGFALSISTPQGIILHTGDFKLDTDPIDGRFTDLERISAISKDKGIRLLLSDSTNAEEPGHTRNESAVGEVLRDLFQDNPDKRIILGCFASHIHRIQQIIQAALATNRKIATLGRSMGKNLTMARELGLLKVPDTSIIDIEDVNRYQPHEICIISTGSQGEPLSALALMAAGENKWVDLNEDDLVILSSHPIPGNEANVGKVIDGLYRSGADVIHSEIAPVHASGHGMHDELETMINSAKPEYFIPVHGEFRHLTNHAKIAIKCGVPNNNVLIAEDGDVVAITDNGIDFDGSVEAGYLYVDGTVGDIRSAVLRDRQVMSEEGVVIVVVTIDMRTGELATRPEVITRGWIYALEADELLEDAREVVRDSVEHSHKTHPDVEVIKGGIRKKLGKFVQERTRRRPMIVPIIMEV